tara:strand:+ start:1215 stop:1391 length:177 start_codon:yes stop_codon:yes gene_type:complete
MKILKTLQEKKLRLDGILYKPYMIGSLPPTFGFAYDEDTDACGITEWFNYKGFTYIRA